MQLKITPKLLLIVLFAGIVSLQIQSQNLSLNIKKADNTEKNVLISLLKKITFSGTDMVLNYQAGSSESVAVSQIQKVTFSSFTALNNTFDDENTFSVYPNPSTGIIYLKNIPGNCTQVTIYSIGGVKVQNFTLLDDKVDVGQLARGIYFIKVNNQVVKFAKL